VRVILYGQGQAGCTKLNQEAAAASETFWKTRPAGYVVEGSEVVCSMTKNGILIEVRDTREHFEGNHICANLQGRGWSEKEGPGEKPEKVRKAHEAEVTASNEQHEAEARSLRERTEEVEQGKRERQQADEQHQQEAKEKVEHEHEAAAEKQEAAKEHAEQLSEQHKTQEENKRNEEETANREAEAG
jgi:hypothetical protein